MTLFETYKPLIFPTGRMKFLLVVLIVALLVLGDAIVEVTGGTVFAYLHLLYIPIVLSGFVFSIKGGILTGIAAGILMSPLLPTYIPHDMAQPFSSWGLRIVIFAFVGALAGGGASLLKAYVQELDNKWITNPLTALPNINGLLRIFSTLTQKNDNVLIVIVCEVQQLTEMNRVFGEEKTSDLIKNISQDLKKAVGEEGILGHLHTHRFVILVPEEEEVPKILKRCETCSDTTYYMGDVPLLIEIQFGLSRYPSDDQDLNHLIRKASGAMHEAKHKGYRISYFDKHLNDSSERNFLTLHQFKTAIDGNTLFLEYQPKVNLQSGKVIGFEALVRWVDPLLGPISPSHFIPLAEETFLISSFTKWLLKAVIQQMHAWRNLSVLVPISVNFSIKNINDPSVIKTLLHLLEEYEIPPHVFEIEITETSITSNISTVAKNLRKLRERGIRISIDDYGTGQASQQYLFDLPINTIKIDKLFIQSISSSETAVAIVKNAISLAHDLKLDVIAEGVETSHQFDLLKKWKCDGAQGYFIGHSLVAKEAIHWLKDRDIS